MGRGIRAQKMINIFVPIPVPNRINRQKKARWFSEVPKYIPILEEVQYPTHKKKYQLNLVLHFPYYQNVDIDNALKGIIDSLKGRLMWDDRQIKELHVKVVENSSQNGVDISLKELVYEKKLIPSFYNFETYFIVEKTLRTRKSEIDLLEGGLNKKPSFTTLHI